MASRVEQFLQDFTAWAGAQADVLAAALVGSHARGTATAESDVDLVLIVTQPERYLQDSAWVEHFGPVAESQLEDYGRLTSLRVWYQDGLEVEYGLTDATWAVAPLDPGSAQVIAGGMRVLFERQPLLSRHHGLR
jgi:predicted nucleotidyltransferase